MGDNIYLGDRNGVRTPMQWTGDRNAGFSRADPARLYAPPIMDPVYGYQAINVEAQERSPFSLLNWMRRMIGLRKQFTVFGRGTIEFLPPQNRKVLTYVRQLERGDDPLRRQPVAHRAAGGARPGAVQGHDPGRDARPDRVPAHRRAALLPDPRAVRASTGSGCRRPPPAVTARVAPEPAAEIAQAPGAPRRRGAGRRCSTATSARSIERERLLPFLQRQRWFGGKARAARAGALRRLGRAAARPAAALPDDRRSRITSDGGRDAVLPAADGLRLAPTPRGSRSARRTRCWRRVTGARKGVLFDAWLDDRFARTLLDAIDRQEQTKTRRGTMRAVADRRLRRRCAAPTTSRCGSAGRRPSRATPRSSTAIG